MQKAYTSGDPYLAFAVQAGAVPATATKESHKSQRDQFKICALAVQYCMGEESLARKLNVPPARSRELLRLHRTTYPDYWRWSDGIEMTALLTGHLHAAFGWSVNVAAEANPRGLRNFPLESNGAEMLRIACILALERGVHICAPVHDALLIEADVSSIDEAVAECQTAMRNASEVVLGGFGLRTDAKVIRFPHRYSDPRGDAMWTTVNKLLKADTGARLLQPPRMSVDNTDFPLDRLRLPAGGAAAASTNSSAVRANKPPRHAKDERFLKGPVPWCWITAAAALGGACLPVSLILWLHAGMSNSNRVRFKLSAGGGLSVGRDAARRAIKKLTAAGLIGVERLPGRVSTVILNDCRRH